MTSKSNSGTTVYTGGLIFDGHDLLEHHSAVVSNGICTSVVSDKELERGAVLVELNGDVLSVGYADLQVNGGGGVLLKRWPFN